MKMTLLAALLCLAACAPEPTVIDFEDESIQVHAIVHAGSDTASITVMRGLRSTRGANDFQYVEPVTNAAVRLVHEGDTTVLLQGRNCIRAAFPQGSPDSTSLNAGCYSAALRVAARAGARYELLVDVPGEPPIRGSALVPEPPVILSPPAGTELRFDGSYVLVRWAHPERQQMVTLQFHADRPTCEVHTIKPDPSGVGISVRGSVGVDTATVAAYALGQCPNAQREAARLIVTVFDTAYTRYAHLVRDDAVRMRDAAAGITGALGVFGAAASAAIPVVLVPR